MSRIVGRKINYINILKVIFVGFIPIGCCLLTCVLQGKGIGDVYLPMSEWNDELFYFKQVEAILEYGYPQGYFGFNESHAMKLSFAAWSPILVLPWVILGKLFGWTLLSPVIYNIVFLTAAMVIFVVLVKPSWGQCISLWVLSFAFTPFARYMMSTMPEIICFSLLIVYTACMIAYRGDRKKGLLYAMLIAAGLLTLMRPYMLLFMLYPMFCMIKEWRKQGIIVSVISTLLVVGIYVPIKVYFGAEYFTPLYKTEWVRPFLQGKILYGIRNICVQLYYNGQSFIQSLVDGVMNGTCEGAIFAGYVFVLALFIWAFVRIIITLKKEGADTRWRIEGLQYLYYAFCFVAMLVALLLMYKLQEGSKHLLTFIAAGLFVVVMMESKCYLRQAALLLVFVYLYTFKAWNPYDYQVPFTDERQVARMAYWEDVFEEELTLVTENVPSFENVCIWVFSDEKMADWQILYELPVGFGISCCFDYYVEDNFDLLQSKYMATPQNGDVANLCEIAGWELLGNDGEMSLYRRP